MLAVSGDEKVILCLVTNVLRSIGSYSDIQADSKMKHVAISEIFII